MSEEKINKIIDELEYLDLTKGARCEIRYYIRKLQKDLEESISKETLRKIKTNTDTYRDFTEEVLKLL